MAVGSENVERLMEWLGDGSPARSAHTAAEPLVERLAALVFQGDAGWPQHTDRIDAYRDALDQWFAADTARAAQFTQLTGPDADPGVLIGWFLPVVQEWEQWASRNESGTAPDGATAAGLVNPSGDGTPGTEYYRFDQAAGQYLYAASADSTDWATYEARRYSERARDDNYGLDYRLDRTHHVYEWYDEATGTWRDQTWANLHVARGHDPAGGAHTPPGGAQPAWDENWAMFYRAGPGGVYEFADAVVPGDQASGSTETWLSHEQVLQRQASSTQARTSSSPPRTAREVIREHIPDIATRVPDFDDFTDDEIARAIADLLETKKKG